MTPLNYFHEIAGLVSDVEKLTRREQEVLELLASGFLYKEICDELGITLPTVKSHLSQIYEKLRVRTRTEATIRFLAAKQEPAHPQLIPFLPVPSERLRDGRAAFCLNASATQKTVAI
jgi:DNA-binding CsgD family transcriptional regulator